MTTFPLRRVSGSVSVAVFAAAIAAGCSPDQASVTPSGTGGDVSPPPSPLCGAGNPNGMSTGGGGAVGGGAIPTPGGFFSPFQPQYGSTVSAPVAPPAISGGTLRILDDGHTAVAADPDRDQVYIVDLVSKSVRTVVLNPGDEPGRVAIDGVRAHVALRRGGAVVSIDTATGDIIQRRAVCAAPRGITSDATTLYVACAGGELVSLPTERGDVAWTVNLGNDLRDVVVDNGRLRVSRFATAEVLTVEMNGTVSGTVTMPAFRAASARGGQRYTPSTAWKMTEMPDNSGVMVLHQRGVDEEVQPVVGGYGGPDACNGIVHPTVTMVASDGSVRSGPAMAGMVLAVDMAISPDAKRVAVISAGNATNTVPGDTQPDLTRVFVTDTDSVTDDHVGCMPDGTHGPCSAGITGTPLFSDDGSTGGTGAAGATGTAPPGTMTGTGGATSVPPKPGTTCGVPDPSIPQTVGEPIAVAFDGSGQVVVQSREPAMLSLPGTNNTISLSTVSRKDTGHLIFHSNAGGFLACASCHAEGNDDGRVWNFTCQGARRTQSLQAGGLRGSEPFHWDGQETDMTHLMVDVFQGRMSGPTLETQQIDGLMTWIDAQPRVPRAAPIDAAAVARGRALFNDGSRAACASCHSGPSFTNNMTVDVGTGRAFQVPSLVGIGSRGPFMHDGCAKTLMDRFTNAACGGASHGKIDGLSGNELADLVSYLQSI
jgi:hypothetical protein